MCEQQKLLSNEVFLKMQDLKNIYTSILNDEEKFDNIIKDINQELTLIYLPSHIDFKNKKFVFEYTRDNEKKYLSFWLKYNEDANCIYIVNDLTIREKHNIINNYSYNDFILLLNDLIYIYLCELTQDYKNSFTSIDFNLFQYSKKK